MNNFEPCIIETTTATQEDAERIAAALLEQRLAACVQLESVCSHYVWQGKMEHTEEIRLSIKSAKHLYEQVETAILALHPYDCPQILMLPLTAILPAYKQWLADALI